jgi:hypothetical protein
MTYVVCCVQSCNECVHRLGVAQVAEAVLREVESRQGALSDALLLKLQFIFPKILKGALQAVDDELATLVRAHDQPRAPAWGGAVSQVIASRSRRSFWTVKPYSAARLVFAMLPIIDMPDRDPNRWQADKPQRITAFRASARAITHAKVSVGPESIACPTRAKDAIANHEWRAFRTLRLCLFRERESHLLCNSFIHTLPRAQSVFTSPSPDSLLRSCFAVSHASVVLGFHTACAV